MNYDILMLMLPGKILNILCFLFLTSWYGQTPLYLVEECQLIANDNGRCYLLSANASVFIVTRTST